MRARTRTNKLLKATKENALEQKTKATKSIVTRQRKPLADKTNSASDDNASIEAQTKSNAALKSSVKESMRPRRDRRLPLRFNENELLVNLSKSLQEDSPVKVTKSTKNGNKSSSSKSPRDVSQENVKDNSLVVNRPKRIHRLPAKLGDQIISPTKINVQPSHASTPKVMKSTKSQIKEDANSKSETSKKPANKPTNKATTPKAKVLNRKNPARTQVETKRNTPKKVDTEQTHKVTIQNSDNNNNPNKRNLRKNNKTTVKENNKQKLNTKEKDKANYNANYSYRVLEDKASVPAKEKLAVYEFTFDPAEEPAPQKKKRKQAVRKKAPPKPKNIFYTDNYNKNITKTLASLKNIISTKTGGKTVENMEVNNPVEDTSSRMKALENTATIPATNSPAHLVEDISPSAPEPVDSPNPVGLEQLDQSHDINYSPAISPSTQHQAKMSDVNETRDIGRGTIKRMNLQEELSFFDEIPVASSSLNASTRNVNASPWRVEFNNLPIKWSTNTYVKPNMTPAVESSFVIDNSKKHVYTNILSDDNNMPEIVNQADNTNLKQRTLISFFKEVCEKKKSVTPTKSNSVFNDSCNATADYVQAESFVDNIIEDVPAANVKTPTKRKRSTTTSDVTSKSHKDVSLNVDNCFGFDESTLNDQENIYPNKKKKFTRPVRKMKTRSKVLGEVNDNAGPYRAHIPLAKEKELQANIILVAAQIEEIPDIFIPEKEIVNKEITEEEIEKVNNSDSSSEEDIEEETSKEKEETPVGLFEDLDVVHHNKPVRKSYGGKLKTVAFKPVPEITHHNLDDSEDLNDPNDDSFHIPVIKERKPVKKKPKQKMSRKEVKEVEEWAAGFNSMCEEVDEFDLVVE